MLKVIRKHPLCACALVALISLAVMILAGPGSIVVLWAFATLALSCSAAGIILKFRVFGEKAVNLIHPPGTD